ncbi:hypothetical protein F5Y18DRAFT_224542 [Xylariaceae sp. FL1019]|nr:hypothetical protein F5Y18DRAFT_224542 [Xylariaceae sp. FL1019]
MGLGKWRFGSSRAASTESSNGSETSTRTTSPTESSTELRSSYSDSSKPSLSTSSSSSPRRSWFKSNQRKKAPGFDDPAFARLHKPFTEQNLEHQKMLNAFEWNFGRQRRPSTSSWISSVSPGASRRASIDFGDGSGYGRDDV